MTNKKKQQLINGLNEDLANELGASILYLYQCSTAAGWDGEELRELLQPEITEEMGHAIFLSEKVVALGGKPTTIPVQHKSPKDVKGMLQYDLKLEKEAVANYTLRAQQAEAVGETALKIKLEELIVDETMHAEKIERILRGM